MAAVSRLIDRNRTTQRSSGETGGRRGAAIRTKLQLEKRTRDLALFNPAIDSKLRGCDVVAVRVDDVATRGYSVDRAIVRQKKTGRPVNFELTEQTRESIDAYLANSKAGFLIFFVGLGEFVGVKRSGLSGTA